MQLQDDARQLLGALAAGRSVDDTDRVRLLMRRFSQMGLVSNGQLTARGKAFANKHGVKPPPSQTYASPDAPRRSSYVPTWMRSVADAEEADTEEE